MRFLNKLAVGALGLGALTIGSCAIPQAAVECNTAAPMFAFYTLESGVAGSACAAMGGDVLATQRYLAPGETDPRLGLLPASGALTRAEGRTSSEDPSLAHEAAMGHFKTMNPDERGICDVVNIADGYETYDAIPGDPGDPDAGIDPTPDVPETTVRHAWENVRVLSTAQIQGTLLDGEVTVTQDGCTAKYHVYAVNPIVLCQSDADCDPAADPANGRATGSGMNPVYSPRCKFLPANTTATAAEEVMSKYYGADIFFADTGDPDNPAYGVCFPADDKTIDALLNK